MVRTQKIIIADSNKFFREGLKSILLNIGKVKIVGEAESGNDLLELMEKQIADIVFVEVNIPKMNGIEVTRKAHVKFPDTTFIAFSTLENKRYVDQMMEAGAEGYLSKNCDNYDLFTQIIKDRHHGGFISPGLKANQVVNNIII
jgi:DNA-binding NarL/FixJ family response regulator